MRNVLIGTLVGTVGVAALATPGAVYLAQARRPVVQPTELVTVTEYATVPGPTVTMTETETEKIRERVTEQVTVADPELETALLTPDPATARAFVRALFLECIDGTPTDDQVARGAEVYLKAYREGNDPEARTREWLHTAWKSAVDETNSRKRREGRRDFC
ncbi:MAG: hypothetical protein M3O70_15205 [Actinomycetota bacterium]|nr:hypothetical protein [Actinomycetota bacterium]